MEDLLTKEYDMDILNALPHLRNYPEMLPFIGSQYENMTNKIFILGESHYFDEWIVDEFKKTNDGSLFLTDWYNQSSRTWEQGTKNYIYTRGNLIQIEIDKKFTKPLTSYYNIRKELQEHVDLIDKEKVFSNFVYFNFFQRPAMVSGESIINNELDNEIAYSTFVTMAKMFKPNKIIFASIRGYEAFNQVNSKDTSEELNSILIDFVPHASCKWWNKRAKKYNNMNGKEKFISLLK